MKLTDIDLKSASELNAKMQAKLGWSVQLDRLTVSEAKDMMASIDNKLNAVRRSNRLHESQNDKAYTGMLLARNVLESFIAEAAVSKAQQQAAGAALAAKRGDAPKKGLKGASKGMMDMSTKELEKIAGTKHKGLPKHVDEAEDENDDGWHAHREMHGNKGVSKEDWKKGVRMNAKGEKVQPKKMSEAGLKGSKDMTAWFKSEVEKKTKGKETVARDKKGVLQPVKKKAVKESILSEDEVNQAESMMAAKDMVDSIQGMLEDVSRMLNEQLPPLTDNIRGNMGGEKADAFSSSAMSTLNTLLAAVQQARTSMDGAVRGLSGEAAPIEMPDAGMDMDAEVGAEDDLAADDFAASDAATGGELPMGREKRA